MSRVVCNSRSCGIRNKEIPRIIPKSPHIEYVMLLFACVGGYDSGRGGSEWDRIGPWNLYNAKNSLLGESGTVACAASPQANPDVIYAGGQNNGVSSGIIKSIDGGKHWLRKSKGLWDTRILGVWVFPGSGSHVLAGTHSGIYESHDAAESWTFRNETRGWGGVMSFREGVIQGAEYILANGADGYIFTMPKAGGMWKRIKAPGGIANNAHLSVVTHGGKTELITCIGGWGGGKLYYGSIDTPTNITWTGPVQLMNHTYPTWDFFPGTSAIYGRCQKPDQCNADVHPIGQFPDLTSCQKAINSSSLKLNVSSYTYQHNVSSLGDYAGWCYAITTFAFDPQKQANVDSGRAPGLFPGGDVDCSNAAVDPRDRNHLLFSKGGQFHAYESKDGGRTVREFTHSSAFFVMIDQLGWLYTATQSGSFVSTDGGDTWTALHVWFESISPPERIIDRVPHDFQRIVPDFRTDQIALPSDQGLHYVNRTAIQHGIYNLSIATGDMKNTMALSAILSPSTTTPGSRNLIVNLWDWNVGASWDDGASWAGWAQGEASPGYCGEGGGGQGLGASGYTIMFHRSWLTVSADGGHNWVRHDLPGGVASFDYVRKPSSRSEPSGTWFAIMSAPAPLDAKKDSDDNRDDDRDDDKDDKDAKDDDDEEEEEEDDDDEVEAERRSRKYSPPADDDDDENDDEEMDPSHVGYTYHPGLSAPPPAKANGNVQYLLMTSNFGQNWTWSPFPEKLQAGAISIDPTNGKSVFAYTGSCLAHSADQGVTWSDCWNKTGLTGKFSHLLVKDSNTLFMIRGGAVPLRSRDGGETWEELTFAAPLYKFGATYDGSLSWSGKTLVLSGVDMGAIDRGAYGTVVWKSTNDGDDFIDETGDLVTVSPGPGVWYEKDFYFITRGEGVTVKRNFE